MLAWVYTKLGRYTEAECCAEQGLWLFRRLDEKPGTAAVLDTLGFLAASSRNYTAAVGYYDEALRLRRDLGDHNAEANTLDRLGDSYLSIGRLDCANIVWQRAATVLQAVDPLRAQEITSKIASFS
jgi:tetratricopeptide (TPR) repeat protein